MSGYGWWILFSKQRKESTATLSVNGRLGVCGFHTPSSIQSSVKVLFLTIWKDRYMWEYMLSSRISYEGLQI